MRFLCVLSAALLAFGCASNLSEAVRELETGRPAVADRQFRALERDFAELAASDQARYALYRGLTHLTLGDLEQADTWLSLAHKVARQDLRAFSHAEHGRLLAARRSMGKMPGEP